MTDVRQDRTERRTAPGGADSEVGRLRTVLLHRPGRELQRLTPRNNDRLLFDGIPWVERAQEEHDAFAQALTDRGVEVLYLSDLLVEALASPQARVEACEGALAPPQLGDRLAGRVAAYLDDLDETQLADVLMSGLRHDELAAAFPGGRQGVVSSLLAPEDFVVDPLPNLLFTRDSSAWVRDQVAVTSLAMPARRRETSLTAVIYRHHPRFAGTPLVYEPGLEHVEGGDVLLLGPGVVAVGTGERTTPAGVERLARRLLAARLVHTVLAVPVQQERATMHLDTVCTMVDADAVVMYPNIAHELKAFAITAGPNGPSGMNGMNGGASTDGGTAGDLDVAPAQPFLLAAAKAMGIDELRVIDTGLDPVTAEREQWDDGNNTLALAPRVAVAYERNTETNARLEAAGIEVVAVAGSELGSGRGGPRCMSCPITRDPL
jgi:arginine deiminase